MTTSENRQPNLKHSFASVVARAPPGAGPSIAGQEAQVVAHVAPKSPPHSMKSPTSETSTSKDQPEVQSSFSKLDIRDGPKITNSLNEQAKSNIKRAGLRLDDDSTHISSSTNANSFDAKSTASGTTFAFDERESLRPDDSASVQAADDDETGSGLFSGGPNSRIGSEAGSRAFREQFNEVSANAPPGPTRLHPLSQGAEPDSVEEMQPAHQITSDATQPAQSIQPVNVSTVPRTPIPFGDLQPDTKLFEALESPKDRMFLLRLEQDIVNFIQNTREPKLQLPPCNSFCRLLAHKLADYYGLSHFVDNVHGCVNLFRTPYCQVRTPLHQLARAVAQESGSTNPAPIPTMKIMRRPEFGNEGRAQSSGAPTTESSLAPSKAGSESGESGQKSTDPQSPTESTLAKDKSTLTLAEREARYKEKREQLFGPQSESADTSETNHETSRVSSRNEERKKKRKPKAEIDDFDTRSQFNPLYPPMGFAPLYTQNGNASTYPAMPHYQMPLQQNGNYQYYNADLSQQGYQHALQAAASNPNFQGFDPSQMLPGFGNSPAFQGYEQQPTSPFLGMMQPTMMMNTATSTMQPASLEGHFYPPHSQPSVQDVQTPRGTFSQLYQPAANQQEQYMPQAAPFQHFHMGRPPNTVNGSALNQVSGPIPRPPTFNPHTRSFFPSVPGNGVANQAQAGAMIPPNYRSHGDPLQNGTQFHQSPLPYPMPNSLHRENALGGNRRTVIHSNESTSPAQSSLSKWGTPPNLPPKPPPPEAPGMPESLPVNNQFGNKVQPTGGSPSMQHYPGAALTASRPGGH